MKPGSRILLLRAAMAALLPGACAAPSANASRGMVNTESSASVIQRLKGLPSGRHPSLRAVTQGLISSNVPCLYSSGYAYYLADGCTLGVLPDAKTARRAADAADAAFEKHLGSPPGSKPRKNPWNFEFYVDSCTVTGSRGERVLYERHF